MLRRQQSRNGLTAEIESREARLVSGSDRNPTVWAMVSADSCRKVRSTDVSVSPILETILLEPPDPAGGLRLMMFVLVAYYVLTVVLWFCFGLSTARKLGPHSTLCRPFWRPPRSPQDPPRPLPTLKM